MYVSLRILLLKLETTLKKNLQNLKKISKAKISLKPFLKHNHHERFN